MRADRIVVSLDGSSTHDKAAQLAAELGLPLRHSVDGESGVEFILQFHGDRLELAPSWPGAPGPIYCDFRSGSTGFRIRNLSVRRELLLRAMRGARGAGGWPRVLDATAGLGRDTFLMAAVGCVVFPLERDPIVRALLADGLRRARAEPRISVSAARIFEPLLGDAISQMAGWVEQLQIDAIYLDPMFAPDALNAKSKKEMQILQRLVMEQDDAEPLLRAAVATGVNRIVVKRGRQAPTITGRKPDRAYLGRSVRYDVYDRRAVETAN